MDKAWSGRTGGSQWEQRSLIRMFRYIDPLWLYPIMWFWIAGYILTGKNARKATRYYWRERHKKPPLAAAWHIWSTYIQFGKALLDRFACWGGRKMTIRIEGQELWDKYLMHEQPLIIIGSHTGNLELAGYVIPMPQKVYTLVYTGDSETVEENRTRLFNKMGINIIPIQEDGGHIFDMHQAIADGHVVSILGDRLFFHTRALKARLLGEEARFPEGCYRFAVAEKVPVLSLYLMREGRGTYTIYVRQLSDGTYHAKSRKEQAQELLETYTQTMEDILSHYPEQWFNFFEFWK